MESNITIDKIFSNFPDDISMKTKIWGPPAWFFLFNVAFAYPKKINSDNNKHIITRNDYRLFFTSLKSTLPCFFCRQSYSSYLDELPLLEDALNSRKSLMFWVYSIKEKVNDKLGVPKCQRLSFKDAVLKYKRFISNKGCVATTESDRINKLKNGCSDDEIKNIKCLVEIVETDSSNNQINKIEHFNNNNNKSNIWIISFLLVVILFLLGVIFLRKTRLA